MRTMQRIGLTAASVALLFLSSAPAMALTGPGRNKAEDSTVSSTTTTSDDTTEHGQTTASDTSTGGATQSPKAQSTAATQQAKQAATKLKVCEKREKVITNIMTRTATRGQKQIDLFSGIADKTEAFYVKKGKTLSTYDSLVADVTAKKAAAQTTVDAIKAKSVDFKCDGTDPKGAASAFKTELKAETAALKEFKTSVKNLIVGVKSVQSTTDKTPATTTPTTSDGGAQ